MPSIRLNLLKWLIVPLLAINLVAGILMFNLAWTPAQMAFDENLTNEAWALISRLRLGKDEVEIELSNQAEEMLRVDRRDAIFFVIRNAAGKTLAGDEDFPALRSPRKLDTSVAYNQEMRERTIRVASLKTLVGGEPIFIGVAETLRKREEVKATLILELLAIESLLTALLVFTSWFAVSRGLRPLHAIQTALNARSPEDLSSLSDKRVSSELRPLIDAIDSLLLRAQTGARAKQDFLATVAHQLRTPLAGLKTQLEWLLHKHGGDQDTSHSCTMMMSSIDRMVRKTNQLLALARAEPSQFEKRRLEPVELDQVVTESVQHFVQEAGKKNIDLGFELQPTRVAGDRFLLRDLIDNLVDNAIRYSPPGAMVTVSCYEEGDSRILKVEDNGPGIPPSDREKVFSRFYRLGNDTTGSGLGLAIVRDIAGDHDASIHIDSGPGGKGTVFSVRFP